MGLWLEAKTPTYPRPVGLRGWEEQPPPREELPTL